MKKGGGRAAEGPATRACADCEQQKGREEFSKTQWARDERRCTSCIGEKKKEHGVEGGEDLLFVDDAVMELEQMPDDEAAFGASLPCLLARETLVMQGDQACSDRGRPGTCSSLEYVHAEGEKEEERAKREEGPRLVLHPLLFLRSMSYVGHYQKEGVSFATPSLVVQVPRFQERVMPPNMVPHIPKENVACSVRVWSFRNCPATLNILSHGWVFEGDDHAKIHRNVDMGCFGAVGVAQKSLPVGRMNEEKRRVRVSVHRARGMMACSPNNAILRLVPLSPGQPLRRFWLLIRDGERSELTLNALIDDETDMDVLAEVLKRVAARGNQTLLRDACEEMRRSGNKTIHAVLQLLWTFLRDENRK